MTVEEAALRLSREQRLQLIEKLWDSLTDKQIDGLDISADVHTELERRIAAHRRDPGATLSWAKVKRRVCNDE